jgi:hypothetical protein
MWFTVAVLIVVSAFRPSIARAQGAPRDTVGPAPQRPTIIANRR